ncbi:glutathione-binding protein GsiB precursor [Roseovarius sp. A-2]|nr:ABC transporter substrate-binding protein [Roseovarius sp. A-2]GAW37172.1 glutathione-binding protein GsiB precursor [Roseovarius sp. A-2]
MTPNGADKQRANASATIKETTVKRRHFLQSTSALLGGTLLSSVALPALALSEPVKGGTLIWGHSETTQNLDIHQTGTASTGRVLENVHDSIVTVDKDLKVIPNLAESYDISEDGTVYTFKLRNDVVFHNGKTMTSEDVKYSFERCKDPATGAVNFEVFNNVAGIETPDDTTVVVTLDKVNAPFIFRLAENVAGVVMPAGSGDEQGNTPIGCGPFKFVRREFGNEVELARFDDYWGGPAHLDKIIAREITEPTVRLTGLRTGELHMINDIPADRITEIEAVEGLQVVSWFPLNWDFVNFNHDFEPFKDPKVREAFDYMIDKEALLEGALWGQGKVTASPSYPTSASYDHDLQQRPQDIEKAKALLAEAGYGPGELSVVFKATTNYPYHIEAAQIMLEWFRMAGVDATIEQLTWSDWLSQVWVDKDFQISMMNFFTLWEPDFLYYSMWNTEGAFNYRKISHPKVDELWQRRPFHRRTTNAACRALWRRGEEVGVEPEPADESCPVCDGMSQLMNGKAAVTHEDDIAVGQPAAELARPLAGPVGQQLVPAATLSIGALRWRQQGQDRQGLHDACPRDRRQHHEAQPAQAAGLDEVAMTGADGIAIDAARRDLPSPPAFDGVVHSDDHRPLGHKAIDDHDQQAARHRVSIPAGTVEDLVIAREIACRGAPRHSQTGADGALARREDGSHHQNEHMLPAGGREVRAQRVQPMTQDPGNRIARRWWGRAMMLHPMFRIPRR